MKPVPSGFRLVADHSTRSAGDIFWGGTRVLRLTPAGAAIARGLLGGEPIGDARSSAVARRLLDAGLAHPVPVGIAPEFEVIVPVCDRVAELDRCLASLASLSVTVVDDASHDGDAVATVARRHGARVVVRARNGGPAAARNTGLAATTAPVVAFVDSDAVVSAEALQQLALHLNDPAVVAVAPRIRDPLLDMGLHPAKVRAGSQVPYVPATTLVLRRTELRFDESLRYGEDVDLVWRLVQQGGSVRYDPSVSVTHACTNRLARRYAYGTSVGPLSRQHADALRGPTLAGMIAPLRVRAFLRAGLPATTAVRIAATAPVRTAVAFGRWAIPTSAGDVAYTVGIWRGCIRARTVRPLLPKLN